VVNGVVIQEGRKCFNVAIQYRKLTASYIRKELELDDFDRMYYGFLSEYVHSRSSPISNCFCTLNVFDKTDQGFEASEFRKIETFSKLNANLTPIIGIHVLNLLDAQYGQFIDSNTKLHIIKVREQMTV